MDEKIKLIVRYIIIGFVMYLAYMVTSVAYINTLGSDKASTLQVATGSIFAALTMIIKFHFDTKVEK